MFCPNCGTQNTDDALFCANCGTRLQAAPVVEPVPAPAPVTPAAPVVEPVPAPAPVVEAAPVPEAIPAPPPVVEPTPVAEPAPAPEAIPAPPPVVEPTPVVEPAPTPVPVVEAAPEAIPAPPPVVEAAPVVEPAPAPAPAPAPEKKEEKPKSKSKLFILIGAVAAAIIVVAIGAIIALGKFSQSGGKVADYFDTWYDDNSDETYITYKGKTFGSWFNGRAYLSDANGDYTVGLFTCNEDLYVGDSKLNLRLVSEEVDYSAISYSGNLIAYVDEDGDLYSYNTKNGNVSFLTSDVVDKPVISPNGKVILCVIEDDGDEVLYAYIGKKSYKLARDVSPIACSDNAKFIYYYDPNKDAIYVSDKNYNTNKLGTGIEWGSNVLFTKDISKIMFSTNNGVFVSENGGDKVEVYEKSASLTPLAVMKGGAYTYNNFGQANSLIMNVSSFGSTYYMSSDSDLVYMDAKLETNKIVGNIYSYDFDSTLKNFFYTNSDNTLYYVKLGTKGDAIKAADDIKYFYVGKGNTVYYINEDEALCMAKGVGKGKKIADDVEAMDVTYDGICLFTTNSYNDSCELYAVTGTSKKMISDECYTFYVNPGSTMYLSNYDPKYGTFDLYLTQKGTNFWNALTEVTY